MVPGLTFAAYSIPFDLWFVRLTTEVDGVEAWMVPPREISFGNYIDKRLATWFTSDMTETKCPTCQTEAKRAAGIEITNAERNQWMLWGCTCTPEAEADALAYMALVTQ